MTTPLKSLLKKSFDNSDETPAAAAVVVAFEGQQPLTFVRERSCSPRKAVHFSDVDQIKLMSHESLSSTAPSDGSNQELVNATQVTCSTRPVDSDSQLISLQ